MSVKKELANWKERLRVSHKKQETSEKKIKLGRDYYRGKQWQFDGANDYKNQPVDNLTFSNTRIIVSRLSFRNPKIFVKPTKKPHMKKNMMIDTISASLAAEIYLNYYLRLLNFKRELRRVLYDTLLGQYGIMEMGYTLATEKIKDDELLISDELIKSESVFFKRRSPFDFRRDPEGTDHLLYDDNWIAFRHVMSLDDMKKSDRYSTTGLESNCATKTDYSAEAVITADKQFKDSDPDIWNKVEFWKIWDKKKRRLISIAESHDKFLQNEKWPEWTESFDGFPCEVFYINENPDEAIPVGDTEIYKVAQDEVNVIDSMMLSHLKRISGRRYVAGDNVLADSDEEEKLANGGDGTIVKIQGATAEGKIIPLQDAGISQDIYIVRKLKADEIRGMSGVADFERGGVTKFDTATEPSLINAGIQTLRDDQRQLFEDFIVRSCKKGFKILQATTEDIEIPLNDREMSVMQKALKPDSWMKNFFENRLVKIAAPNGAMALFPFLKLKKEDIAGEFEFEMEVGSTMPHNAVQRRQDAMTISGAMQNNPYIRGREATIAFLEAFDRKDIEELVKTDQEVAQEAEMARKSEIDKEITTKQPKVEADLVKTRMKNDTSLLIKMLETGKDQKKGNEDKT